MRENLEDLKNKSVTKTKGIVYLIGAGPGDPGLLTVRGAELLQKAEVVIYDYLVNPELLKLCPKETEIIYAGKSAGKHTLPQDEINALLVSHAQAGACVIRLKGGDPYLFGRGGEEAEALVASGLPFVVVPGITSAISVPAYAGIPVTHRDYASSFAVVTGHESPLKNDLTLDWSYLAKGIDTLVFLMGVGSLPSITANLIEAGRDPQTPVAVVRWGTRPEQQTVVGSLADIAGRVQAAGLKAPAVTIVGEVVKLRERLRWFDQGPLFGKKIVVTRSRDQASSLSALLTTLGAAPLELPLLKIVPCQDQGPLAQIITRLQSFAWLIFSSVNGVEIFFAHLHASGLDARALGGLKVAVTGPATASALQRFGIKADLIPPEFVGEALAEALLAVNVRGKRILYARAAAAREIIPTMLVNGGAMVETVDLYDTLPELETGSEILTSLAKGEIDVLTFTSASTVDGFVKRCQARGLDLSLICQQVVIASIGPITTSAAEKFGLKVHLTAATHSIPGLVEAIQIFYSAKSEVNQ